MAAPYRGQPVVQRQHGVGVAGDIQHGKIVDGEGVGQTNHGQHDEHEQPLRGRSGHGHPGRDAALRADDGKNGQRKGNKEGDNEGEVADFRNHLACLSVSMTSVLPVLSPEAWARLRASAASGGI